MEVDCRAVEPGDEAVLEAACRVFGAEGDIDAGTFLRTEGAVALVAEDGDGVTGWAYGHELVHPDGERTMLLYALDVAERARGGGIGRALTEAFVDRAREAGCTEVWALTEHGNRAAIATYLAAGGERDTDDPVMFSWALGPRTMS